MGPIQTLGRGVERMAPGGRRSASESPIRPFWRPVGEAGDPAPPPLPEFPQQFATMHGAQLQFPDGGNLVFSSIDYKGTVVPPGTPGQLVYVGEPGFGFYARYKSTGAGLNGWNYFQFGSNHYSAWNMTDGPLVFKTSAVDVPMPVSFDPANPSTSSIGGYPSGPYLGNFCPDPLTVPRSGTVSLSPAV